MLHRVNSTNAKKEQGLCGKFVIIWKRRQNSVVISNDLRFVDKNYLMKLDEHPISQMNIDEA